ncbi:MAG: hypothetical protein ACRC8A_14825 [Microcoleaceae cyanobacterium]
MKEEPQFKTGVFMNLFPSGDRDPWNGNQASESLDPLKAPSQLNYPEIEDVKIQQYDSEALKTLRRSFIFLIVIGLLVGILVATGVIYVLDRFDIKAVPEEVNPVQ